MLAARPAAIARREDLAQINGAAERLARQAIAAFGSKPLFLLLRSRA
jgi:hypothetical protein